ncbi:MAG TPA: sigma-70 family RNA polymerase sigma factor [Gemmatimonadaceae bacterium]|nr:sigma-70 family RNA polymerase sigma factor [Gemmatimonadaceae bacterium]
MHGPCLRPNLLAASARRATRPTGDGPPSNLPPAAVISSGAMPMTALRPPVAPTLGESTAAAPHSPDPDVALAAGGDRRAFERIYRTHVNRVYSVCARMVHDQALAEELTQDVFVRAWEKLSLFRGEAAFSTWLHRLAVNVVLNRRKTDGRDRARHDEDPEVVDGLAGPMLPTGISMDLEKAIAKLPPGARRVFVLHDVEGYKHEEIAEMLGVTSGGSKAQLHRARMLLREALQR